MAYSKIILNGETLMDVTSDTVDAGNLLSGKTATKNSGAKVTGNIATKSSSDLTASGATVTAPAGYYSASASKAVTTTTHPNPTAAIASSTGVVTATHTQGTGYVTGGTTTGTLNLTTQAAQTINTSTADRTIASYRWLTGTQTIKSVTTTNLTAANIASGVVVKVGDANNASRITQVTGTYAPTVSSLTVTPTETAQTFNATGVYGYKPVTINAISSTYVGTGIVTRSASDISQGLTQVTVPEGYYSSGTQINLSNASHTSPTITIDNATGTVRATHTLSAGYVITGNGTTTSTYSLAAQAAQTIYPSTVDQTITRYQWLTGSQTIKSVRTTNLTASNIAEGVTVKVGDANNASRITQVTGTHIGGTQRTFTITGTGNSTTCYIQHNNIKYYSAGSFLFKSGDIANLYVYGNSVTFKYASVVINGTSVHSAYSTYSSAYTLPDCNITANLLANSEDCGLSMNYSTIDISQNGGYDVCDYGWAHVDVGGYTADEIALRSISGSISGNASSIRPYAFYRCENLTYAYFPLANEVGQSAFGQCKQLSSAVFSSDILVIDTSAFNNCSILTTAIFPTVIMLRSYAYNNCSNLSIASFDSISKIEQYTFERCYALTNISFPSCVSIMSGAFSYCMALSVASFPVVRTIYPSAFAYCMNLLSLYLLGSSVPTLSNINAFTVTPISNYTTSTGGVYGSIFVPASLYNSYLTATNWSVYSSRFVSV